MVAPIPPAPVPRPVTAPASVSHVTVRFGDALVLDDVTAEFPAGRITALVGPSGSGKSTLLNVLAGLQAADHGEIHTGSEPKHRRPGRIENRIGLVHQSFALLSLLTATENVELAAQIAGTPRREVLDRAAATLSEVGLTGRAQHLVEELSGGEQQRVAIARALVTRPRLLLADEPTAQLDADNRALVLAALRRRASTGATVIIATHDLDVAGQCDAVVRLSAGRNL